jgi:hypothetical protein
VLAVAQQMALVNRRQPVDLVLLGCDNVCPNGDLAQLDRLFVKHYQELLANKVPFFAVLGNHNIRTRNGEGQVAYPVFGMGGAGTTCGGDPWNSSCWTPTSIVLGRTYLTVGGGGAYLRPVLPNGNTAYATSQYSFAGLNFESKKLRLEDWNAEGQRIDQAVLSEATD